jgi:hypothetical protein
MPEYKNKLSENSIKLSPARVRSSPPIPINKAKISFLILIITTCGGETS